MSVNLTTKISTYGLLAKFKAGWFAEACDQDTETTTGSLQTYSYNFADVQGHAREGSIVVDGSDVEIGLVCRFSISGPMRDYRLPANTYKTGLFSPVIKGTTPKHLEFLTPRFGKLTKLD